MILFIGSALTGDRTVTIMAKMVTARLLFCGGGGIVAAGTKERILNTALKTFSEKGYGGTSLRELLSELGFTKAAFYKHYQSKEELWNAVLDAMECYYSERFGSPDHLPPVPQSTAELKTLTLRMLEFTIHDEKIIMTRKLLLTEQFHDDRARLLATRHFSEGLETLFAILFAGMMENGSLRREDPAILSLSFTAPVSTLVQLCDREPQRQRECMEKIEGFLDYFISVYGRQPKKKAAARRSSGEVTER